MEPEEYDAANDARRLQDSRGDITEMLVGTYLRPPSSLDQVAPCGINQANQKQTRNIPFVAFSNSSHGTTGYPGGLTGMRENGHNQNVLSSQDSYIDQTNVNLTVDCQKRKPNFKRKKDIKVCQNQQQCKSRLVNESACRLNSCHEITELENSSSAGQLTSSVTQDFQCQNACSSTSLVKVPKRDELEIRLPQNHVAKLPVPSTSMQTFNKERTASSEKQNNPYSSSVNSEVPSAFTKIASCTIIYNSCPESDFNLQSPFPKFCTFNNRIATTEDIYFKPQVPQFSDAPITSGSCNISLQENLYNDNSSVCLKNTDSKNSVIKENTTGVPLQTFRSSAHIDRGEKFAEYNNENECSSTLNKRKRNMNNRKGISEKNRMDSNTEKECMLLLKKSKNSPQSRLSTTNVENPHLSRPHFSPEMHDYYKDSASNVSTSTCTPPLYFKPSELEKQSPLHLNEEPHLPTFSSNDELMSRVHAIVEKVRSGEIMHEWWKIDNLLLWSYPSKLSSSANVFEKQKSFLNTKDGERYCSGQNSRKIDLQGTYGDSRDDLNFPSEGFPIPTFSENPEASRSGALWKRRFLQSFEESCSKNPSINDRKFSGEIIQGKSLVTLKQTVHNYSHSETSNEQIMHGNPISKTYSPIVQPGRSTTSMEKNTCSLSGKTLSNPLQPFNRNNELISNKPMPLNLRKVMEIKMNNKECISKNSQKEEENSLNPLLLNVVNTDMQRAKSILMETRSRNYNNDDCVDTSESPKPNTENSTTLISLKNLSKDSTSNQDC